MISITGHHFMQFCIIDHFFPPLHQRIVGRFQIIGYDEWTANGSADLHWERQHARTLLLGNRKQQSIFCRCKLMSPPMYVMTMITLDKELGIETVN